MGYIHGEIPKLFSPRAAVVFIEAGRDREAEMGPNWTKDKTVPKNRETGGPDFGARCVADMRHLEMGLIVKTNAPQKREGPIWWL